jgi:hypothetical protein
MTDFNESRHSNHVFSLRKFIIPRENDDDGTVKFGRFVACEYCKRRNFEAKIVMFAKEKHKTFDVGGGDAASCNCSKRTNVFSPVAVAPEKNSLVQQSHIAPLIVRGLGCIGFTSKTLVKRGLWYGDLRTLPSTERFSNHVCSSSTPTLENHRHDS